jgi:hypothetical protein
MNYKDSCFLQGDETLKKKKMSLSHQNSGSDFFKSSSGTCASPPVLLNIGGDDPDDLPAVAEEVPLS